MLYQDHITGKGRFLYEKTGDEYRGAFRDGKRHGMGEYVFANGNRYVGQWVDNEIHGKGKFANISSGQTYVKASGPFRVTVGWALTAAVILRHGGSLSSGTKGTG
jgi:hypothetical protein